MNARELTELKVLIVHVGQLYNRSFLDGAISMMAEDLADLSFLDVKNAFAHYRRNPKNTFFPLPAAIRALIEGHTPEPTLEDDGRVASSRIISAVSKYGWNNPERAHDYIGELGWEIVNMYGGWTTLCSQVTTDNIPSLAAQFRELALSVRRRHAAGLHHSPPALESTTSIGHLTKNILKRIEGDPA